MNNDEDIYSSIPTYNLKQLWQLYVSTFLDEFDTDDELKAEYQSIRSGVNSPFEVEIDIYDIIDEETNTNNIDRNNAIIVSPQKQIIIFCGKTYPLYSYRTEKERRKAILQKALLDAYSEQSKFGSQIDD